MIVVIRSVEEIYVVVGVVGSLFKFNSIMDFVIFELDSRMLVVVVGVIFGENFEGFFVMVFGDKEMGRFRNFYRRLYQL